ncbi:MAG: sigma-70 family RNA polymerase sigma factor [Pseudomonadota bacterium]
MTKTEQQKREIALVELSMVGNRAAFDRLFRIWSSRWMGFARRQCDSEAGAEDAMQSAVLQMIKYLPKLKDPQSFPAWSFVILRRCCIENTRQRIRQRETTQKLQADAESEYARPTDPRLTDLSVAVASLSQDQQNLLMLFYGYGLTIGDIATVYELAAGTVKSRLFAAREAIKEHLIENEEKCHD